MISRLTSEPKFFTPSNWSVPKQLFSTDDIKKCGWDTHASLPTIVCNNSAETNEFLILFSPRKKNISRVAAGKLMMNDREEFWFAKDSAYEILGPGEIGTYNECGVMPSFVSNHTWRGDNGYGNPAAYNLYTCGWSSSNSLPFHQEVGVHSLDLSDLQVGPALKIVGRDRNNPRYVTNPSHIRLKNGYDLVFFVSCSTWRKLDGIKFESEYQIKFELYDNCTLIKEGVLPQIDGQVAACRPWPVQVDDRLFIFFSARTSKRDYNIYCCEYVNLNHFSWTGDPIIELRDNTWYSEMACYPSVMVFESKISLVFCGNGYGQTGFGIATSNV